MLLLDIYFANFFVDMALYWMMIFMKKKLTLGRSQVPKNQSKSRRSFQKIKSVFDLYDYTVRQALQSTTE